MIELLREYWEWFLFDTLVWTGALIAMVMVLRRPVAKHFGSSAAYALWFIPLARLFVPPFTLPAWMNLTPREEVSFETAPLALDEAAVEPATFFADMAARSPAPQSFPDPTDFVLPLVAIWLVGAAVMLTRRFYLYFELRRDLLDDARPVGDVGSVRLIETPAISGPMAFGVVDRVIALPAGFMASRDRISRDLAIAHELAHHRGGDLIVNMAVQPLFAIHWFNPLGWLGWSALRRDQEAACDARVVAARPREERATYAGIIADFARHPQGTPRPALAAPMACPVLGDKSIIHRLRSLNMSDISPRRRIAGRATLASAFLAVPLTASFCFAEVSAMPTSDEVAVVGSAPLADLAYPVPPAPPEAPLPAGYPEAPLPPVAPEAPLAPPAPDFERAMADADRAKADARRALAEAKRVEKRWASRDYDEGRKAWAESRIAYAESRQDWAEGRIAYAEGRKDWAEGRVAYAEAKREQAEAKAEARHAKLEAETEAVVAQAVAHAMAAVPEVIEKCVYPDQPVTTKVKSNGKTVMYVCETAGDRIALSAIRGARKAIAKDRSLNAEIRAEILRDLDEEIAELESSLS
ncbi:M56 family metallopeptidase [Qipengyuania sp. GH38]|uniref:M56 family metallopeptidase n=1 Tax=Qipengyuania intermedia TaxID=2867244 RepID=UPI001C87373A|nr:M56 family metallopeptidase [Qipengyuania intermedia]MBX7515413.1 M56 family metallopeptidase [Qipengyuania intermedia]